MDRSNGQQDERKKEVDNIRALCLFKASLPRKKKTQSRTNEARMD